MSALGDIGRVIRRTRAPVVTRSVYGVAIPPTQNTATGSGASANALITVFTRAGGYKVDSTRADSAGSWSVYDLDDGTYYANEVGSARSWSIVIVGAVATVTQVSVGTVTSGFVGIF